jgi:hypothetical protein
MPKSCTFRTGISVVHFLNHIKIRTLPYVVRFQYRPQTFAHTFASWNTEPRHFSLRSQKEGEKKCIEYFGPVHQFSSFWTTGFLFSFVPQKQTTSRPFCSSSTPNPPASNMAVLRVVWRPVHHNYQQERATAIATHWSSAARSSCPVSILKPFCVYTEEGEHTS